MSPPVQELPSLYKLVCFLCLPLTRSVEACLHPTIVYRNYSVGRGHVPAGAGTAKSVQACSCAPSAAYAVGTPGGRALRAVYRSCSVGRDHWARRCRNYQIRTNSFVSSVCRLRGRHAGVVCAEVFDEGALRMRRTPCGCVPYEPSFVAAEKGKKIARADCADEAGRPVGCGLVPVSQ